MLEMWKQSFTVKCIIKLLEDYEGEDEDNEEDGINKRFLDYLSGLSQTPDIRVHIQVCYSAHRVSCQPVPELPAGRWCRSAWNFLSLREFLAGVQKASLRKSSKLLEERKKVPET